MFGRGRGFSLAPLSRLRPDRQKRTARHRQFLPNFPLPGIQSQYDPGSHYFPTTSGSSTTMMGIPQTEQQSSRQTNDWEDIHLPGSTSYYSQLSNNRMSQPFDPKRYGQLPFAPTPFQSGTTYASSQQMPSAMMAMEDSVGQTDVNQLQSTGVRVDIHGNEDWEKQFLSWRDIGEHYKQLPTNLRHTLHPCEALPAEEIKFCLNHGIKFEKELGAGSFGSVWLVTRFEKGSAKETKLACKILNLLTFSPNSRGRFTLTNRNTLTQGVRQLLSEAEIHKTLRHKNIVNCRHIFSIHDRVTGFPHCRLLILMELCEGDLQGLTKSKPKKRLSESEALVMFKDISAALKYLHDQNVCHLDVKSENIMYVNEKDGRIRYKLADFGLSKRFDSDKTEMSHLAGTYAYMAPEMIASSGDSFSGKPTDVYSLGCVLAEAVLGIDWRVFVEALHQGSQSKSYLYKSNGLSPLCGQLISRMTDDDPSKRPTIAQVCSDPWLSSNP